MSYWAILVAAVAGFVFSAVYYGVFGDEVARLNAANPRAAAAALDKPPSWKFIVEFGRCLTLASVLAWLVVRLGVADWKDAVQLGLVVWIGFPLVLWAGAIIWENVPLKLAALHGGDWLAKTVLVAVIVAVWRR